MLCQQVVADLDAVQHLVGLEEPAVVGKYLVLLALEARIHIAEILLHAVVERTVFVHLLQLLPLVNNLYHRVGRQQSAVLGKEDEEQAVEQFLCFLEEQQLPVLYVPAFWGWIVFQDVGKEQSFEL